MRILIVNIYFRPDLTGSGWLFAELADSLIERGHDVEVLTAVPHYGLDSAAVAKSEWKKSDGAVRVHRVPVHRPRRMTTLSRVANYISFCITAGISAFRLQPPDAVVAVWPTPAVLSMSIIARHWGVPLVFSLQDIASDSIPRSRLLRLINRTLERAAVRASDAVITLTDRMRERCLAHGALPDRVHVVPNWVDLKEFDGPSSSVAMRRELELGDCFVALAAGNIGRYCGYDTILDAAARLIDRPDIIVLIVGRGHDRARIVERARREGLRNVRCVEPVPRDRLRELYACADVGLVSRDPAFRDENVAYRALPMMACELPILAITSEENEIARMVVSNRLGVWVDPGDPAAVASHIRGLADDPSPLASWGTNGRRFAERFHRRDEAVDRYLRVISGL
ncbi:MAG: glycosyltransferase family 4 protein [Phycisphaerales bacterium JB043]